MLKEHEAEQAKAATAEATAEKPAEAASPADGETAEAQESPKEAQGEAEVPENVLEALYQLIGQIPESDEKTQLVDIMKALQSKTDEADESENLTIRELLEARELLESIPGDDEDFALSGGSAVIAPDSSYVQGPVWQEACILLAEIQPERITEGHLALDTQGHYARPDVFHLEVNDRPQPGISFASNAQEEPSPGGSAKGGKETHD